MFFLEDFMPRMLIRTPSSDKLGHCPCVLATEKYDQVPLYAIPKQGEVQPPTKEMVFPSFGIT
jgi:hypothetical protein